MFLRRQKFLLQLEGVFHLLGGGLLVESVKSDHKGFQLPSISCLLPTCADFPKRWVQSEYVVVCPLGRESPMTTSHLFFFVETILTQALTRVTPPYQTNHCPCYCSALCAEPEADNARAVLKKDG